MTIEVRWGSATHAGCVRSLNQDALLAGPSLFVVADGMGGHAAGEVASGIVIARMATVNAADDLSVAKVLDGLATANADVREVSSRDPTKADMGTTASGIALVTEEGAERVLVFNIGDSRVYRWNLDTIVQVTVDHSVVGELVEAGSITEEEAARHPRRNVVTRAVGIDEQAHVDSWLITPTPGERYLVCSDGLTRELSKADLLETHRRPGAPQEGAEALLQAALERGARDNVSVILVEVLAVTDARSEFDDDTNPRTLARRTSIGEDTAPRSAHR